MITAGSVKRDKASEMFPFLEEGFRGRRKAIKGFTHLSPDFVFWIFPNGRLFDAKDAHSRNFPKGYEYILDDEPDYGGFLRGRIASNCGPQVVVVYCREKDLLNDYQKIDQFLIGMDDLPIPLNPYSLVISDNGDIYGTMKDIGLRRGLMDKSRR